MAPKKVTTRTSTSSGTTTATTTGTTTGTGPGEFVDPLTDPADADGVALEVPDEPLDLKVALRHALLDGRPQGELPAELDVAAWLWDQWGAELEPVGFDRDQFAQALDANRRELWLWLIGDRQWTQFASGLVGRISRRLPAPVTS
jgi:hypothetical protein